MDNQPVPEQPKGPGEVTYADVQQYPHYYLATQGPGRDATDNSKCEHDYLLTANCPSCP